MSRAGFNARADYEASYTLACELIGMGLVRRRIIAALRRRAGEAGCCHSVYYRQGA